MTDHISMQMKMMKPIMVLLIILGVVFAGWGFVMQQEVGTKEAAFHALQDEYFSNAKSVRDGAETGSLLSKQLVEIQQTPSELLRLKLVGIGRILIGIFFLLLGILIALMSMPRRLNDLMEKNN